MCMGIFFWRGTCALDLTCVSPCKVKTGCMVFAPDQSLALCLGPFGVEEVETAEQGHSFLRTV